MKVEENETKNKNFANQNSSKGEEKSNENWHPSLSLMHEQNGN